jgi:hypothetical protein
MERKTMVKRTVLSVFCAAALLFTGAAYAQDSATLTLRSGEKVSGQLVDLGGVGYTVRVGGTERHIPQNDVSVIDFTGSLTDADWTSFTGTSKVVLRNGQTFDGSLYDIGGTSPLRLTIRTANGEREVASNEVARILISRPEAPVATSGTNPTVATPAVPGAITVLANQAWTSTGVAVRRGQTISLSTTGQVQLSDDVNDIADANGARTGRMATNSQLRTVPAGALIGRIGPNGAPFGVGTQTAIVAPAAGVLFLGVNDDAHGDNKGNYQVIVR